MSEEFETLLYAALDDEYHYGEGGRGGTSLETPIIKFVNALEAQLAATQSQLAAFEEGYDPAVKPVPEGAVVVSVPTPYGVAHLVTTSLVMPNNVIRWFPLPGTKEAK